MGDRLASLEDEVSELREQLDQLRLEVSRLKREVRAARRSSEAEREEADEESGRVSDGSFSVVSRPERQSSYPSPSRSTTSSNPRGVISTFATVFKVIAASHHVGKERGDCR